MLIEKEPKPVVYLYLQKVIIDYCWQLSLYGGIKVYDKFGLLQLALVSRQWLRYTSQFYNKYLESHFNPCMNNIQEYIKHIENPYCLMKSISKIQIFWKTLNDNKAEKTLTFDHYKQLPLQLITSLQISSGFFDNSTSSKFLYQVLDYKYKYIINHNQNNNNNIDEEEKEEIPILNQLYIENGMAMDEILKTMNTLNNNKIMESITSITLNSSVDDFRALLNCTPQLRNLICYAQYSVSSKDLEPLPPTIEFIQSPLSWCELLVWAKPAESLPKFKRWSIVSRTPQFSLTSTKGLIKTYYQFLNHFKSLENGLYQVLDSNNLYQRQLEIDQFKELERSICSRENIKEWVVIHPNRSYMNTRQQIHQQPSNWQLSKAIRKLYLVDIYESSLEIQLKNYPMLTFLQLQIENDITQEPPLKAIKAIEEYLTIHNTNNLECLSLDFNQPFAQHHSQVFNGMDTKPSLKTLMNTILNHQSLVMVMFTGSSKMPTHLLKSKFTNRNNVNIYNRKI